MLLVNYFDIMVHMSKKTEIFEPKLIRDEKGLKLTNGELELYGDFTKMAHRLKQSNLERELLVKAIRIKSLTRPLIVMDATAGLGEDSMLIAAAGHEVHLYESDETIGALLRDAHERALTDESLRAIALRMNITIGDSIAAMTHLDYEPDVIYLDPMFPKREKSAEVKKKFQLIHGLEEPCTNEQEMLDAAIKAGPRKIVIKRPVKGPFLAGRKPDYSITGNSVRYDCLVFAK